MVSVQDRLLSLPLVPILVALTDLASPGVVVCWKILELHTCKLLLWRLSVLVHIQAVVPLARCLELERTQHGTHSLCPHSGGVEEEGPTA